MKTIIYDGSCALCLNYVKIVLKYDKQGKYNFASLTSEAANTFFMKNSIKVREMIWLIDERGSCYSKSSASLHILAGLGGVWSLLYIFVFVPKFIRDGVYDIISKRRKRLIKGNICRVISTEHNARFLS